VEEAMNRTIQWYVDHQDWWRDIRNRDDYKAYYQRQYGDRLK
jgi:dTDP-glucose 4,6-dehydratase